MKYFIVLLALIFIVNAGNIEKSLQCMCKEGKYAYIEAENEED